MKFSKNRIITADKSRKRRLLALLFATVFVLGAFGGCSEEASDEDRDTTSATASTQQAEENYYGPPEHKPATASDIYCVEVCSYSGQFLEDQTFEEVENVAAIWIENRSDEFLDLATITYDVGEGKEAVFEVKGLPPKSKTLVLEKNRMALTGKEKFVGYPEVTAAFNQYAIMETDNLLVTEKDGVLSVSNVSGSDLEMVTVYYKLTDSEGNFMGGAAYVSYFGSLKNQETKEKEAPLFAQNAKIVKYSYQIK